MHYEGSAQKENVFTQRIHNITEIYSFSKRPVTRKHSEFDFRHEVYRPVQLLMLQYKY